MSAKTGKERKLLSRKKMLDEGVVEAGLRINITKERHEFLRSNSDFKGRLHDAINKLMDDLFGSVK